MTTTLNASNSGSGGLVQTADASGVLALQTAGVTAVTVNTSQNVGIGTTSPTVKLDVVGAIKASGVITSTVTTGTAPFTVASTTQVANLNAATAGTAGNVTGTVAVANGGTGLTSTPTNGQIDIGNGTGFTRAALTAGSGISITNGVGSISIATSGGSGTVTSVGGTGTVSGISLSGTVTTSGNLTLGGTLTSITSGSAVTASGTSVGFTGLPSWVKRITLIFQMISTNGGSFTNIQLGTGGGPTYTTSGYTSGAWNGGSASTATGFLYSQAGGSGDNRNGMAVLTLQTGNTWVCSGNTNLTGGDGTIFSGYIALGATLTAVRISTVNGTDSYDNGIVNIFYEG